MYFDHFIFNLFIINLMEIKFIIIFINYFPKFTIINPVINLLIKIFIYFIILIIKVLDNNYSLNMTC